MNSIIFIEGVSGVGKTSTTAQLSVKLRDMGYKVSCYLEGANDNPLDPFGGTYPPVMPISEFAETYLRCWQNFSEAKFENDFMIVDGTLLHHQINDLLREYNAPDEIIANQLSNLINVIRQLNPIIFYLSASDVGQRLAQAQKSRKQSVPTDEQIARWENRKIVDLYVLDRLPVESHILCVDNGWSAILKTMIEYIVF